MIDALKHDLRALSSDKKAASSAWFFKTGPGQYGEGDVFLGVTLPEQRQIAKKYGGLSLDEAESLLHSAEHEFRMTALLIWVGQFRKGDEALRGEIYRRYLANTRWINNWDLVDTSAPDVVGHWLETHDRAVLDRLVTSDSLWERRIAMLATFWFIKQGDPDDAFRVADRLLTDKQDLIHKSVGWMLREVGKKCGREVLEAYLLIRYKKMPRTMLRYAIEHFEPERRRAYLDGAV